MKYTYRIDLQGTARDIVYLKMLFDRTLASGYFSCGSQYPPELIKAVNQVEGVVTCTLGKTFSGGLITVNGNELVAKLETLDAKQIPLIASRIVKRVQRRFAKNESRKRIKLTNLQKAIAKLNKQTYGIA